MLQLHLSNQNLSDQTRPLQILLTKIMMKEVEEKQHGAHGDDNEDDDSNRDVQGDFLVVVLGLLGRPAVLSFFLRAVRPLLVLPLFNSIPQKEFVSLLCYLQFTSSNRMKRYRQLVTRVTAPIRSDGDGRHRQDPDEEEAEVEGRLDDRVIRVHLQLFGGFLGDDE